MTAIAETVTEAAAGFDARHWPATLELVFSAAGNRSRLSSCRHQGPLYVQKPFYPEGSDWPHVYLLHPPGGVVSGDCLDIAVRAEAGAGALLTTPGASRFYRARETASEQRQRTHLQVDGGAVLEWFPLETIVFDGARAVLDTRIELAEGGCCITWEITCFGLPASGELFDSGIFSQRYTVSRDGQPLFIDHLTLSDGDRRMLAGKAGMGGQPVTGFLLAGPWADQSSAGALLESLRRVPIALSMVDVGTITQVNGFIVGRYLGGSAARARRLFTAWWQLLRPALLGRDSCAPRIWFT